MLRLDLRKLLVSCCGLGLLFSGAASAQAGGYSEYRASLLAKGWKPNVNHGLKTASGKALYRFPEVLCGPQLCSAKWRDPQGNEQQVMLLRGYDGQDHRLAPQ
jgi:hypothetical protein